MLEQYDYMFKKVIKLLIFITSVYLLLENLKLNSIMTTLIISILFIILDNYFPIVECECVT